MQLSAAATFSFPDLDALKAFLAAHEERQTAKIIPLPGLPISKDVELAQRRTTPFPALPVIAPEAFDFDFDQAWEHIGAIEPRAAEDPSFLMHFRAEDDKGGKSKELQRFTDVSLLDVKNDTSFSELVPWENKKGEIVYWQMNKPGYLTLQSKGAALHVLVNESCGNHRRRKKDIVAYRAIFCEHDNKDGKSLEELIASFPLRPSLIIESSPGKYHFLWLFKERWPVNPETDELWRALQQNFVDNYGGDENAMDPSRVLRLAGSLHLKGEHWRVPIVENNGERFSMADLVQAFKPVIRETKAQGAVASTIDDLIGARADFEKARVALQYIHPACDNLHAPGRPDQLLKPYKPWLDIGMALCARFGNEAYTLWDTWSAAAGSAVYPGSEATWTHWESFSEPGDDRHGRPLVTLATIFGYAKQHGWPNGPVPQWDLAPGGPQIAPVAGSRDGKPITVPSMLPPASGPATANTEALPAAAAAEPAPAQPQAAAHWLDTPNPFQASALVGASAKFPLIRYRDIKPVLTGGWLIKGLLPSRGLCVVYGQPTCGKSFLTLHAMLHVAAGKAYAGRKVRQARVVYIAAEGQGGFRKRVCAAGDAIELDKGLQFDLVEVTPNLGLKSGDAEVLIEAIRQQTKEGDTPVGAIVIDTLARALGCADENGEGMATFIENAGAIEQALKCLVAPVHHTGWDNRRMRGWSGLHGAADVEWAVSKEEGKHEVHVQKMKDGEDGLKWQFTLKVVPVGLDEDKDLITTCVVDLQIPSAEGTKAAAVDKAAANQKAEEVFMKLLNWTIDHGLSAPSPSKNSHSYAPRSFAEHDESEGISKEAFLGAMERLLSQKRIDVVDDGPPSRLVKKLVVSTGKNVSASLDDGSGDIGKNVLISPAVSQSCLNGGFK